MANYKVTLKQVYKDGRDTEILYPETKSDCVVTTMAESGVSPASQTGQALTANVNLNTTLDIINKYLTNMQKYVFNALGTSVAASSSASIPASMQALDDVYDQLTTLRNVVGLNASGSNKPTHAFDIMSFIGINSTSVSSKTRYVRLNSGGLGFQFDDSDVMRVGYATEAQNARNYIDGGTIHYGLMGLDSKITAINNGALAQAVMEVSAMISQRDRNDYYLVVSKYRQDNSRSNSDTMNLTQIVKSVMHDYVFDLRTNVIVGSCSPYAGVMYSASVFSTTQNGWSALSAFMKNTKYYNSTHQTYSLVDHCFTIPQLCRKMYNEYTYILMTCKITLTKKLDSMFYPPMGIVVLGAKNPPNKNKAYCCGNGAGANLEDQSAKDFDCELIFQALPGEGYNIMSSGVYNSTSVTQNVKNDSLVWLKYDIDNSNLAMLLKVDSASTLLEHNHICIGTVGYEAVTYSNIEVSIQSELSSSLTFTQLFSMNGTSKY